MQVVVVSAFWTEYNKRRPCRIGCLNELPRYNHPRCCGQGGRRIKVRHSTRYQYHLVQRRRCSCKKNSSAPWCWMLVGYSTSYDIMDDRLEHSNPRLILIYIDIYLFLLFISFTVLALVSPLPYSSSRNSDSGSHTRT